MQAAVPHRFFDRLLLALMVIVVAAPLTYLEVTHPGWQQLQSATTSVAGRLGLPTTPPAKATPRAASAKAKPATTTSAASAGQPAATTSLTQSTTAKTATTNSYVHLRAAKSVNSTIITDLTAGTTVQLTSDADDTWQGVVYQGKSGYIYRAYLQY